MNCKGALVISGIRRLGRGTLIPFGFNGLLPYAISVSIFVQTSLPHRLSLASLQLILLHLVLSIVTHDTLLFPWFPAELP